MIRGCRAAVISLVTTGPSLRARITPALSMPEGDGRVLAWAALAPVSDRCVYAGVVENSIYVAERARGRGIGQRLLTALVEGAERAGIWTVQTGIFPENTASLALHHACGFRLVGVRERIGQLDGRWRDVLLLERRSKRVGR